MTILVAGAHCVKY